MKRLFILASAAIVALAACTKTEVVYTEAPAEIGFKAITGAMTKAVDQWDVNTEVMGLYAYEAGTTTAHLENVMFKKDGESFVGWSGSAHQPYYWPLGKNLDFVVYAPYAPSGVTYTPATKILTYPVDNSDDATQIDVLYGAKMLANSQKSASAYAVDMKHALAWIQVKIKADQADVLEVNSFNLTNIVKTATMNVDYTDAEAPVLSWTGHSAGEALPLLSGEIGTDYTTVDFLIIPAAAQTAFAMNYDLGTNTGKTWDKPLTGDWKAGYKYVYNIEVGASEIKIAPTVDSWETNVVSEDFAVEQ